MRNKTTGRRGMFALRMFVVFVLCSAGVAFDVFSLAPSNPASQNGPKLAALKLNLQQQRLAGREHSIAQQSDRAVSNLNVALRPDAPTFGHPIISGIGGLGFEESLRIDPTN